MDTTLLLASASPRRRRLLCLLGLEYATTSVEVDETIPAKQVEPHRFAESLAVEKALAAIRLASVQAGRTGAHARPLVIGADTVVVLGDRVLGKPADREDARRMLQELSGRTHTVITALALATGPADVTAFSVSTEVMMERLDDATIDEWLASDEALGCAGAYNIERHLASVSEDECHQNVAGLPACHLYRALKERLGSDAGLTPPVAECDRMLGRRCRLGPALL
ncbi:MAG: nucleoside triphosphate pyrophosphatase [Coriobacteriia bacterium]